MAKYPTPDVFVEMSPASRSAGSKTKPPLSVPFVAGSGNVCVLQPGSTTSADHRHDEYVCRTHSLRLPQINMLQGYSSANERIF